MCSYPLPSNKIVHADRVGCRCKRARLNGGTLKCWRKTVQGIVQSERLSHYKYLVVEFCGYGTGLVLVTRWVAAGVRLVAAHFAWQAWHLVTWTVTLRGRRGTVSHGLSLCVAGVALSDMDCHFAWILYFCSFCTLRLGSQWELDAFCLDMFSQSVTCKQRHVQLHCACCL